MLGRLELAETRGAAIIAEFNAATHVALANLEGSFDGLLQSTHQNEVAASS